MFSLSTASLHRKHLGLALPAIALLLGSCQFFWPISSYDNEPNPGPAGDASAPEVSTEPAHCSDGIKNHFESDTDCGGGQCQPCGPFKACAANSDCRGGKCLNNTCAQTCTDKVQNQGESDIDCGGPNCTPCVAGRTCSKSTDCKGGECAGGFCAQTCADKTKNQDETDVDCGGTKCPKCASGLACKAASDCEPGSCRNGICRKCESTGAKSPGAVTTANPKDLGCNSTCWMSYSKEGNNFPMPEGLALDDRKYVICDVKPGGNSNDLQGSAFGFDTLIPATAEITGIRFSSLQAASGTEATNRFRSIRLLKAGKPVGDDRANTTLWPKVQEGGVGFWDLSVGANGELWGEKWLASDTTSTGFGYQVGVHNDYTGSDPDCSTAYLDYARLEVFFCY